jgi:hypothetical protein
MEDRFVKVNVTTLAAHLRQIPTTTGGDEEDWHEAADAALLNAIGDAEVIDALNSFGKWYS